MSETIGDRIPAPIRFEFGIPAGSGQPGRAVLLATVDGDGTARFAVIAAAEISCADDKHLRFGLAAGSATSENLAQRQNASLFYVLDAAAYTIKGRAAFAPTSDGDGRLSFEIEVDSVWRDFRPDAPMISGPTYRVPEEP